MQTIQNSNQVEGLLRPNRIHQQSLLDAMDATNRADFLPPNVRHLAGADAPIPLSLGRGLASPLTLAHLVQALDITPGQHVLVLAGNTGFSAAVCASLVGPQGRVTVVEDTPDFLPQLQQNLAGYANINIVAASPVTYKGEEADAVLLDATIQYLPAQAIGWLKDGASLATIQVQSTGLPAAVVHRRHGKALFEEIIFDIKGQTAELNDSRFTLPQTFVF